ncbi:Holliday junction resolvase RuvX [Aquiluna borgnonia]|jgi:putative Holliday junction resolvase|uniref:Putative pre-16S rRNA nuclease n=1 Tax=Aquiluna borgnonia TaxID=2499157 RepID=A0A7D4PX90_9MICO|nr:Holliday junction resolvase RuvX [Aquiluna borgnonia]QKJ25264.1 Holliday junction resolvase RuvX [Aquiluna borgnonia]
MAFVALDVGDVRIGLAFNQGELVLPKEVFQNTEPGLVALTEDLTRLKPEVVYVGLPLSLSGGHTASTSKAIEFARKIQNLGFTVRLVDERMTTRGAQAKLTAAGKSTRDSRSIIDSVAAMAILELALANPQIGLALEDLDA